MWNCQGSLSLFLISKTIAQEALPILYGENEFTFNIASWSYPKNSLSSPLIFGPLGEPHRLHLIRNLRNIQIIFLVEMHRFPDHWTVARYRGRIEHFIKVLKQHVDDENQKSLLKTLRIKFCPPSTLMLHEHRSYVMYPLEALISMSGIENVSVEGVEDWFAKCLEMCIKGQGGDVKEIKWPMVRKKTRKADMHGSKNMYVTTRKWFQPELDWAEFAERNGISRAFSEYILPGHK
ncbi:hypothetical protein P280DRAFT_483038 [Massarina eburnea CBS 473.64]|uniref:Uncharacterized protein n=1 Tax=Massarina eburnea CBS 473.64 TaxID=1395130 RepID=A0A6A6RPW8_9PLEO|nr:hypothetical protein P280DRAFT_483038 [Massarina eburnea CBS 473.64]